MELEQSKGEVELGLETQQFLDSAAQARAKLTFCLFLDEARNIRSSYLFMGFNKANLTKLEPVKTFQCVCACMYLAFLLVLDASVHVVVLLLYFVFTPHRVFHNSTLPNLIRVCGRVSIIGK